MFVIVGKKEERVVLGSDGKGGAGSELEVAKGRWQANSVHQAPSEAVALSK